MSELDDFEASLEEKENELYVLRLYITGMTPNSKRAVENIKKICEQHLANRYELEIIDIYQQPELAASKQIIAVPTLIKISPAPVKKIIGDLSSLEKVMNGLNLRPKK